MADRRLTRRELVGTAVTSVTLLAGCEGIGGDSEPPTLERALFRLDGSGDIRFALAYTEAVDDGLRDRVASDEVVDTDPTVTVDGTSLDWTDPYRADDEALARSIREETDFTDPEREIDDLVSDLQSAIPDPDDNTDPFDLADEKTIRGRIEDAVQYDGALTGQRLSLPRVEYGGPIDTDGFQSTIQFPDGFVYQLPLISKSRPAQGGTYGISIVTGPETDNEVSFSPQVADREYSFELDVPSSSLGGSGGTLVPELRHRNDRILSALRAGAHRRRLSLGLLALGIFEDPSVNDRSQELYDGDGLGEQVADLTGSLFPTSSSIGGVALYVVGTSVFMLGAGYYASVAGAGAIWIGGSWFVTLLGQLNTVEAASQSLDTAFDLVEAQAFGEIVPNYLAGDPDGKESEPLPELTAIESLATLQSDWVTTSLALASPADVADVTDNYRALLETQRDGLDRIATALGDLNAGTIDGIRDVSDLIEDQRDTVSKEIELLDGFEAHAAATGAADLDVPTRTDTATSTPTSTPTPTPTPVVESFTDDWSDGDYQQNPTWFVERSAYDTGAEVVDIDSPAGSRGLALSARRGNLTIESGESLRFDAPWTIDILLQPTQLVQPNNSSRYKLMFGSGSGGLFGASSDFEFNCFFGDSGSETQRRATLTLGGSLVDEANQIERVLSVDTWYRVSIRHDGSGGYQLSFWPASESREDAAVAPARGDPPQTDGNNQYPIQIRVRTAQELNIDPIAVVMDYFRYRTDPAMRDEG